MADVEPRTPSSDGQADGASAPVGSPAVEVVELEQPSLADWVRLTGREAAPFGERTATLAWRRNDHHVGLRDPDGTLVASGGVSVVTVAVGDDAPFEVVGFGGLIIAREARGRGLMRVLMDAMAGVGERLGPHRAMMFCEEHLVERYERRGYTTITGPVTVDQPDGPVEMPLRAMWRPLGPGPGWPPGPVRVHGLPF
jgi:predicted GNAT family N-acyltransferase